MFAPNYRLSKLAYRGLFEKGTDGKVAAKGFVDTPDKLNRSKGRSSKVEEIVVEADLCGAGQFGEEIAEQDLPGVAGRSIGILQASDDGGR